MLYALHTAAPSEPRRRKIKNDADAVRVSVVAIAEPLGPATPNTAMAVMLEKLHSRIVCRCFWPPPALSTREMPCGIIGRSEVKQHANGTFGGQPPRVSGHYQTVTFAVITHPHNHAQRSANRP